MEALILSCGTGGGHNAACAALQEELSARGHGVTVLNPYTLKGTNTAETVDHAYISLVQNAPKMFGALYRAGDAYRRLPWRSPVYRMNRLMAPRLERYLRECGCDVVVTTHLFPAEILTNLKRQGAALPRTCYVATDYTCIPFTEETDCDSYVIPARELADEFVSRGIPRERVAPLGIPVRRQFRREGDRSGACSRLGLDPSGRHILVAGGSIGAGRIREVVSTLLDHYGDSVRPIVVCGNNQALYRDMEREYGRRCTLLGYTAQMADYMRACDLFVSKPGGLSSTEAAVVGTALVHVTPIPGCETRNMRFFSENGMSAAVTSPEKQLAGVCDSLLEHGRREEMAEAQRRIVRADAAAAICDLLVS